MAKHELGEVWKEDRVWKIQLPFGIHTTKTKGRAELFSLSVTDPDELSRRMGTAPKP